MIQNRIVPVALMLTMTIMLMGCGERQSGMITGNGGSDVITSFVFKAPPGDQYPEGAAIKLGGRIVVGWTPEQWDILIPVGTVHENALNVTYSRPIWDAGFSSILIVEDGPYIIPIVKGMMANGVELTAFEQNEFGLTNVFNVVTSETSVIIDPIRDDRLRLKTIELGYAGTCGDPEYALPASPDDPIITRFTHGWDYGFQRMTWNGGRWKLHTVALPGGCIVRPQDGEGHIRYADFYANGTLLINVRNLGTDLQPYVVYELIVNENGTVSNPRPSIDERHFPSLTIGHE